MNGRPISTRSTVQFVLVLTILAWATQTLFSQWGYGLEQPLSAGAPQPLSPEKFIPGTARFAAGAAIEFRADAMINGTEVKLRQLCRWSDRDAAIFAPIADLVVLRLTPHVPFRSVSVEEIKSILHDAGVNLAAINFAGAVSCTVGRGDVKFDEGAALEQWIATRQDRVKPVQLEAVQLDAIQSDASPPMTADASPASESISVPPAGPFHTLGEALTADLANRLRLSPKSLQMTFNPKDEAVLNLSEPNFRFTIEPRRVRNLGAVAWDVLIVTESGSQKVFISAAASAWQDQLIIAKPLEPRQIIREEDLIDRRELVDHLEDQSPLKRTQVIGQQATRDLKPGMALTAQMIEAVMHDKTEEFITAAPASAEASNLASVAE